MSIKIEKTKTHVFGWEGAIDETRKPMNSNDGDEIIIKKIGRKCNKVNEANSQKLQSV